MVNTPLKGLIVIPFYSKGRIREQQENSNRVEKKGFGD